MLIYNKKVSVSWESEWCLGLDLLCVRVSEFKPVQNILAKQFSSSWYSDIAFYSSAFSWIGIIFLTSICAKSNDLKFTSEISKEFCCSSKVHCNS